MSCKLSVTNVAPVVTADDLRRLFAGFGPVYQVTLLLDPVTRQFRGSAYIEMATESASAACMRDLNGYPLGGRALQVKPHEAAAGRSDGRTPPPGPGFVYDRRRKALAEAEALFAKPAP